MPLKRLKSISGNVSGSHSESDSRLEKEAILVHSGENGSSIVFQSSDGEISFDEKRIKDIVKAHNESIEKMVSEYGGWDKTPDGAFPALLDQHSSESTDDVIGRLRTLVKFEIRDIPKVGKNCACVIGNTIWLGEKTVSKVKDGRIYHLSVGINDDPEESTYNTLGETSAVIDPAAPGAMLLSKLKTKEQKMPTKKLRLAESSARIKKLAGVSDAIKELSAKLDKSSNTVKLTRKEGEVLTKLSKLMKESKITPAEFKKMNIKKLAALDDNSFSTVMDAYDALEPKINKGQKGSTLAEDFSKLGKNLEKKQQKQLKSEIKTEFKRLGVKMKSEDEKDEKELEADYAEMGSDEKEEKAKLSAGAYKHMSDAEKHLEDGNVEEAKKSLKAMKECSEDKKELSADDMAAHSTDHGKSMSDLQQDVDEVKTNIARLAGIIEELFKSEQEEHAAMEKEEGEEKELEKDEPKKDIEEKELSEEEKEAKKLAEEKAKSEIKDDIKKD